MMKPLSSIRKGELFTLFSVLPSSLFPVFSILSFAALTPIFSVAVSTLLSSFFFLVLVAWRKKWREFRKIQDIWLPLLIGIIINGFLYQTLFVWALQYTTAGNAAIFALSEVLFSYIFFTIWKKEKHPILHFFGASLLAFGVFLILFRGTFAFQKGDLLIIFVSAIAPIGNSFQQQVRGVISGETYLLLRSSVAALVMFGIGYVWSVAPSVEEIWSVLWVLLFNGIIFFGFVKFFFIEAIAHISVSKTIALISSQPAFTLFFAYFILGEVPSVWQISSLLPIILGIILLTKK